MLTAWVEQLLGYASGALDTIRDNEHYPALMAWARTQGAEHCGGSLDMAQALAPIIWNQTPLVRRQFDCEPLAEPRPDEPCWCDSGRAFRDCCRRVALPSAVPTHLMWMLSLREWRGETLKAALESRKAPAQALLEAGIVSAESGNNGRAQQILESLFAGERDWQVLAEQIEPAFEILIDLYQERGFLRKRAALIERVIASGPDFLRAAAYERLCLMHLDSGDLASAREAFQSAQRTLPDSPSLAYIEAMVLLHEGNVGKARQRAAFWWRRLARQHQADPDQLDFIAELADDPESTLAEQVINSEEALAGPLTALQALLHTQQRPPRLVLSRSPEGALLYEPSRREASLYAGWIEACEIEIDEDAALGFLGDPWVTAPQWLQGLCANPEWLDAPKVMQALTLALASRFGSLPWMVDTFFTPLAERYGAWLTQLEDAGGTFSWHDADNATLLRTGLALVIGMERGAGPQARALAQRLLALDAEDSLGLRELVIDQLLREGNDDQALAVSEAGPEGADMLGVQMGRVLALYRLARHDDARAVLGEVCAANPYIVRVLCEDRPRPARLSVDMPEPGTRAEAWQYRQLMRDQWAASDGALEWLSRQPCARAGEGRRSQ
ncbi:SEC-C metal-binding domain-containing protein [Salinicola sp. JS01]|uniref:SEC-C metal-binding domain-containing protein n=1 Tax=Salinicola sp. JS01 TaxID=3050071 RepID=UPI00255B9260|nr:SEC-C metal-binding domain-containing protein [Salinicola sp. JS01]WIX34530.1 SEC-C metal-binding domain-containing protein [Salinicola sp. JS01]